MACDAHLLNIILWVKNGLDIVYIMVPIVLIILLSVDLGKIVVGKVDDSSKILAKFTKRIIVGLAIFFVPLVISFLLDTIEFNDPNSALACWEEATPAVVKTRMQEEEAKAKATEELREKEYAEKQAKKEQEKKDRIARKQKENQQAYEDAQNAKNNSSAVNIGSSTSLKPFVNGTQRALQKGDCMKQSDNCACPSVGRLSGFYFTMGSETGRNMNWTKRDTSETISLLKVNCSDGSYISGYINAKVRSNFEQAFNKICQLRTTGINGVKIKSNNSGTFTSRTNSARTICSYHAYGAAIDINADLGITINGIVHKPYSSMGSGTKTRYTNFVKALGSESDPRNYNYILWKYAFQPAGFSWGGNWSTGSFDPMHFEIK